MPQLDDILAEVGPRATLDSALLTTVTEWYDLGTVRETRDLGGAYNLNILLRTDAGSYVARVYRPWLTGERLATLHAAKHSLAQARLPVVTAIPSIRGESAVRHGDRWLEVEPFIAHDGVADDWDRYRTAFSVLAELHAALAPLASRSFVPPRVSNYGLPGHLLRWLGRTRERITQLDGHHPETERALGVCNEAEQTLVQVQRWWDDVGHQLPAQLTHGDYKGDNLLFRGERVAAVLDLDFLDRRERIFDLSYFLYWILRRSAPQAPEMFPWRRVPELVEAYSTSAARPLSEEEMTALPIEMARVPLYWIAEAWLTLDPVQSVMGRERDVELAVWLARHGTDLCLRPGART